MNARLWLGLVPVGAALVLYGPAPAIKPTTLPPLPLQARYLWERALGERAVNRAPAILVSRFQFAHLRRPKSWQDLAALRDYVEWADRPEAVGFHNGLVDADVSAGDLVLLRIAAARVSAPVPVFEDPVGFAVLDPQRTGRVRIPITLRRASWRLPDVPPSFPAGPVPAIHAAVGEANGIVVLYGESLDGRSVKAACRGGPAAILYKSSLQINVRAGQCGEIAVEVDGVRSDWRKVQR